MIQEGRSTLPEAIGQPHTLPGMDSEALCCPMLTGKAKGYRP